MNNLRAKRLKRSKAIHCSLFLMIQPEPNTCINTSLVSASSDAKRIYITTISIEIYDHFFHFIRVAYFFRCWKYIEHPLLLNIWFSYFPSKILQNLFDSNCTIHGNRKFIPSSSFIDCFSLCIASQKLDKWSDKPTIFILLDQNGELLTLIYFNEGTTWMDMFYTSVKFHLWK